MFTNRDTRELQLSIMSLLSKVAIAYLRASEEICETEHQKRIMDADFLFNLMCKALYNKKLEKMCAAKKLLTNTPTPCFYFTVGDVYMFVSERLEVKVGGNIKIPRLAASSDEIKCERHDLPEGASRRTAKLYNKIEHAVMEAIK